MYLLPLLHSSCTFHSLDRLIWCLTKKMRPKFVGPPRPLFKEGQRYVSDVITLWTIHNEAVTIMEVQKWGRSGPFLCMFREMLLQPVGLL